MIEHDTRSSIETDDETTHAAEAAVATQSIAVHADRIKDRELQQAYSRLGGESTISATERQVIDSMATAIVDDIIAAPITVLDETSAYDDETVETALELFDPTE